MGIMPIAGKRKRVFQLSRYSALPTKTTRRGSRAINNTESRKEMWLGARMAGPSMGTFSRPVTAVGKTVRVEVDNTARAAG